MEIKVLDLGELQEVVTEFEGDIWHPYTGDGHVDILQHVDHFSSRNPLNCSI